VSGPRASASAPQNALDSLFFDSPVSPLALDSHAHVANTASLSFPPVHYNDPILNIGCDGERRHAPAPFFGRRLQAQLRPHL